MFFGRRGSRHDRRQALRRRVLSGRCRRQWPEYPRKSGRPAGRQARPVKIPRSFPGIPDGFRSRRSGPTNTFRQRLRHRRESRNRAPECGSATPAPTTCRSGCTSRGFRRSRRISARSGSCRSSGCRFADGCNNRPVQMHRRRTTAPRQVSGMCVSSFLKNPFRRRFQSLRNARGAFSEAPWLNRWLSGTSFLPTPSRISDRSSSRCR